MQLILDLEQKKKTGGSLMSTEDRMVGTVPLSVYATWARAGGGLTMFAGVVLLAVMTEASNVANNLWLTVWSNASATASTAAAAAASSDPPPMPMEESNWYYLGIYAAIGGAVVIFSLTSQLSQLMLGLASSNRLFTRLLVAVLHAPMSFFDTTPQGRVMNRFAKEIYVLDEDLPSTMATFMMCMLRVLGILLVISWTTPVFVVGLLPVTLIYIYSQQYYIQSSRELQRLESVSRSPIFSLFSESLSGLTTIRAYGAEGNYSRSQTQLLDTNCQAYFFQFATNCWLGLRLEFAGSLIVAFSGLSGVLGKLTSTDPMFAAMAGLSLSFALNVTQTLNWTARMGSDMETQMVSTERVREYSVLESEEQAGTRARAKLGVKGGPSGPPRWLQRRLSSTHAAELNSLYGSSSSVPDGDAVTPPPEWPTAGKVEFQNVVMKYREDAKSPPVLRNISFTVKAGEKVGIAGRTGAGKSTIVVSLLRLCNLSEGRILVDGVDIASLPLRRLRSSIAVIPQDPVLFSGTIRSNLDPFQEHDETQLVQALAETSLQDLSLDEPVGENGSNFSVGQRALLCIARALLHRARVIVMDEATAAVDSLNDAGLQDTIREKFKGCTVLTVAHRMDSISDSDRVLIMDKGQVAEFDAPADLLKTEGSLYGGLMREWESQHQQGGKNRA